MNSALLSNGKIITAKEYKPDIHGVRIHCFDKSCNAPVFFISEKANLAAHFKTSGRGESVHTLSCGFYQKLSFQESVDKVSEYQQSLQDNGIKEIIIRMNLNGIDPDYEARTIEREQKEENKKNETEVKVKDDKEPPQSISSLRSVKKLFTTYEPDILASIIISIKGKKVAISELIRSYKNAHRALWADEIQQNLPYFVHGVIEKIIRRDKVWYINFSAEDNYYFSLVVFERYFKHFTYKDEELIGKEILAVGYLKKNQYSKEEKGKQATEMTIKSNKYIEFIH